MPTLRSPDVQCHVFTFKEGLLSAVAHDLKLVLRDLEIEVDGELSTVQATGNPQSLHVECAMAKGEERPSTLSDKDKKDIDKNIQKDVLKSKKFPDIRFSSSSVQNKDNGYEITGDLQLAGKTKRAIWKVRSDGAHWEARLRMHQPDWGIKPFSAMFGTLKIKPDIDLVVRVRKDALG